jgi:hypothetical protein
MSALPVDLGSADVAALAGASCGQDRKAGVVVLAGAFVAYHMLERPVRQRHQQASRRQDRAGEGAFSPCRAFRPTYDEERPHGALSSAYVQHDTVKQPGPIVSHDFLETVGVSFLRVAAMLQRMTTDIRHPLDLVSRRPPPVAVPALLTDLAATDLYGDAVSYFWTYPARSLMAG